MRETRTVHDPFIGQDVLVSSRLVDRLRGRYAMGPTLPNGDPEFGWREFKTPPIQHEAAAEIDKLSDLLREAVTAAPSHDAAGFMMMPHALAETGWFNRVKEQLGLVPAQLTKGHD